MVPCENRSSSSFRILTRRLESSGSAMLGGPMRRPFNIYMEVRGLGTGGDSLLPRDAMRLAGLAATLLLLLAALAFPSQAGSAEDPEVEDEEDDQETEAGPVVVEPDTFADIDILAAWVAEDFVDAVGEDGPM